MARVLWTRTHGKPERLYKMQRLVDRTSNRHIICGDLSEHALGPWDRSNNSCEARSLCPRSNIRSPARCTCFSLRSRMRRFGPSPPVVQGCSAHAWCENQWRWLYCTPSVSQSATTHGPVRISYLHHVPSTVVLRCAKSGSASLNTKISVGHTKVESLRRCL